MFYHGQQSSDSNTLVLGLGFLHLPMVREFDVNNLLHSHRTQSIRPHQAVSPSTFTFIRLRPGKEAGKGRMIEESTALYGFDHKHAVRA
jgi:hypothetical protein